MAGAFLLMSMSVDSESDMGVLSLVVGDWDCVVVWVLRILFVVADCVIWFWSSAVSLGFLSQDESMRSEAVRSVVLSVFFMVGPFLFLIILTGTLLVGCYMDV